MSRASAAAAPPRRAIPTLEVLLSMMERDGNSWFANYRGIEIRSAFQPVLSVSHAKVIGFEALMRARTPKGEALPPPLVFSLARRHDEAVLLDRLSRAVHVANFADQGGEIGWLFLNVLPQILEASWEDAVFAEHLIQRFNLPAERIVLEVLEQPATDERTLARTVDAFHSKNFLIAIDDFGSGFSNFDRIWSTRPDIVKLDRTLVGRLTQRNSDHELMRHLVSMLHQAGTMVLAEGVEADGELMALMEADVDFVQGYWLARPHFSLTRAQASALERAPLLWPMFASHSARVPHLPAIRFESFESTMTAAALCYSRDGDLARAAAIVFEVAGARSVFTVDEHGVQTQDTVSAPLEAGPRERRDAAKRRLAPLLEGSPGNWSRRAYFKRAIAAPGRVAVMGPYFSLTEGKGCHTAAISVQVEGRTMVFCADFVPNDDGVEMDAVDSD
ncbi:EAL domain-containing protein [Pararobbsia silviterrae]|uniref:EAL domain-containing protein n=1 Tax=Pararobbsia silviterrae TaxID=1792498 RepID=A0A494XQ92_9BURK|nr:EAL domain-containing protein [Pararobbsia silviterrae]RKP50274.1 EAL domain-containing protein [Pararobbsia silviterrae]